MKIIYYVDGPWPSDEQLAEGRAMGAVFRNARLVERPEPCDAVAGAVPPAASHLPRYTAAANEPAPVIAPKRRRKAAPAGGDSGACT